MAIELKVVIGFVIADPNDCFVAPPDEKMYYFWSSKALNKYLPRLSRDKTRLNQKYIDIAHIRF